MDDPDGSEVAYDYSKSRADATLSGGAYFSRDAKVGKSLCLNGGEAITSEAIDFSGDFTLSLYVKAPGNRVGWLLNFDGVDNYLEQWMYANSDTWVLLTFIKEGSMFSVYKHETMVYQEVLPGTPIGLSINCDSLSESEGNLDEVRLYNVALPIEDVLHEEEGKADVEYYVDGQNFKDFGVYVSASNGLLGQLERKEGMTEDWGTRHGMMRAVNHPRYKERTITLECFIEASSRSAFVEWQNRFFECFRGKGTHRLRVEYNGSTKPLVYEVIMQTGVSPEKQWGTYNNNVMVGTFTMELIEDDPVKMVLRHIAAHEDSTAQISLTSYSTLYIYWGDGSASKVKGSKQEVTHTYTDAGEYDIIIAGTIEDIEDFNTSEIVVWQKLM